MCEDLHLMLCFGCMLKLVLDKAINLSSGWPSLPWEDACCVTGGDNADPRDKILRPSMSLSL